MEALVGAVVLDQGTEAADRVITHSLLPRLVHHVTTTDWTDFHGRLRSQCIGRCAAASQLIKLAILWQGTNSTPSRSYKSSFTAGARPCPTLSEVLFQFKIVFWILILISFTGGSNRVTKQCKASRLGILSIVTTFRSFWNQRLLRRHRNAPRSCKNVAGGVPCIWLAGTNSA